ncbi:MAG TPA: signal peptidase I, partial [Methylophilaceae bacterium]|nr:signal peptidase I [Methylophilaceae bacterium]
FPLFMLLILLLTGLIWLVDYLFFQKKRSEVADESTTVEYAKSFFPVILLVFVIRSFIAEPFKIPSGSMMPTLLAGDYILVNKFTYGLRLPVLNTVFLDISQPKRGDVAVFHFPPNPKIDYIKRIVGLPGDKVQYQNKRLVINGEPVEVSFLEHSDYTDQDQSIIKAHRLRERLGEVVHDILIYDIPNSRYQVASIGEQFLNGETVVVPEGSYLAMGDNRDNSSDSRVWGFVPDQNLVGKAFFIWFNFDDFGRIGNSIH